MARRRAQYVQVTSTRSFDAVRQSLAQEFRVLAGGAGTVEDPSAMWFEVTSRGSQEACPELRDLQEALTSSDRIRSLLSVTEGDGKDLARQTSLLSSCGEGLWQEGVPGGLKHVEPEKPKESAARVEQMPLFG
jgi:hypothetical protein